MNQAFELVYVPGDDTTVESHIDPALALSSIDLLMQIRNGSSWWYSVQRHVDDCCDPTKGRSLGAGVEAFPFCSTRLIEMDMGID